MSTPSSILQAIDNRQFGRTGTSNKACQPRQIAARRSIAKNPGNSLALASPLVPQGAIMPIFDSYIQNWFGRDPDQRNKLGETPLLEAAFEGDTQSVFMLLRWTKMMGCSRKQGKLNPSYSQVSAKDVDKLETTIDSLKDSRGLNALHVATLMGHEGIVRLLVEEGGADIHVSCGHFLAKSGVTPLHFAARSGAVRIVQFLLDQGANINATDSLNRSPLWYAREQSQGKTVRLLRSALSSL